MRTIFFAVVSLFWASAGLMAQDAFKGKTLCVMGDSYVRNHARPASETWHARVARRLGMYYVNLGINGNCVAFDRTKEGFGAPMVERYVQIPDSADYILFIAGHNDANMIRRDKERWGEFCTRLDVLCRNLQKRYPQARIGFVTPWKVDSPWFAEVISEIHTVCHRHGIPVLDASVSGGIDVNNPVFRARYFQCPEDVAHLNADGHALLLDWGEQFLRRMEYEENTAR